MSTNPDAFFITDPPPPYCGPDGGGMAVATPTGTLQCPSDKNREGCPCPEQGMTAKCWPGRRANRNHGICQDGDTICNDSHEFGLRWGPCEGYVLPVEGALSGPEACGCFSSGKWKLTNLSPCIFHGDMTYLYSSVLGPNNTLQCGGPFTNSDIPPPPEEDWTESTLDVDCEGQGLATGGFNRGGSGVDGARQLRMRGAGLGGDGDVGAVGGGAERDGEAYAARGAGNEQSLAGEGIGHLARRRRI